MKKVILLNILITYIRQTKNGFQVKTDYVDNKGIIRKTLNSPVFTNKFKAEDFLQKVNLRG